MSARWRALQHRHRYTYNWVIFPPSFTESLSESTLSKDPKSLPFYNELSHLISLSSIYSQVTHAKTLASSFSSLFASTKEEGLLKEATRFYLQVLFLENSLPLHRALVSGLSKVSAKELQDLVCKCFRELCGEYEEKGVGKKPFCLSRVALSVLGMPKLGYLVNVIEGCAVSVGWDVVLGLETAVLGAEEWARPSPVVMEQCQEGLSCLYYLLQRFPGKFKGLDGFDAEMLDIMERVVGILIRVLKSVAFSRDCFVAAGVSLCAALQVCLTAEELGLVIMEGIFNQSDSGFVSGNHDSEFRDAVLKIPCKGDFRLEISSFSVLSRLCLIRGILTAVSRTLLNSHFVVWSGSFNSYEVNAHCGRSVKTILYDRILPELCNYCENPIDSHFNFHALTVLQICLQQMKTSLLGNLIDLSHNYLPISEEMGTRILRIIWNNLEDPLSQTVKQVNLIFDLFLDIHSTVYLKKGGERIKSFLQKIASDLLHLGPRCKGRYVPLASLTRRLGAKTMLYMSPDLLFDTVRAYVDDDVCCAATTFLKCYLECLRDECWNCHGVEEGYSVYRGHCLPPFLYGLASGVSKLRTNLNTYALPVLLEIDMDSIFPMLAFISVGPSGEEDGLAYPELSCKNIELRVEQKVAVLVSLLKVCRSLALIDGDIDLLHNSATSHTNNGFGTAVMNVDAVVCIKGIEVKILVEWLVLALTHVDELLRVDAAESLFLNPKTASLPSQLELTLLKVAVPLNMRCSSTGFQMKWTSLFRKFFSRVRTALERQLKQGRWQPLVNSINNNKVCSNKDIEETVVDRAEALFNFMRWFGSFLFFSCYPSAPYKRKIMAMELILIMLNVWSIVLPPEENCGSFSLERCLYPYSEALTSPDSTLLLVGSIIDSWDRLRESSFRILLHFPTPLPGISSEDTVQKVIIWAKELVYSPRVRESDAGALTLKLMFRKYVLELGWTIRVSNTVVCSQSNSGSVNGDILIVDKSPLIKYVRSLIDWLNVAVEEGERDLSEACKNSFVHGVLLALRYTFEELDWNADAVVSSIAEMRQALEKLLEMVMRISSLALWVVSADAWYLPDMEEMLDDDAYLMNDEDVGTASSGNEGSDTKHMQDNRSSEQIVMVGCWLAMKEVSLLLGTIIRKIPLSSNSCLDSTDSEAPSSDAADHFLLAPAKPMLDLVQLEQIGNHFLEVLLKMKHNGAIDKTRAGFTALCNRLLCSNDPRLCRLTESWMEQLMERTIAKGQTVDDLLRRSAGIPAAFIALFLSEPQGAPKKLLPWALRWLIDVAKSFLPGSNRGKNLNADSSKFSSTRSDEEPESVDPLKMKITEKASKTRDEGVIPTVHAFNVLRAAFNDTSLATDTSGFAAEALIVSIRSFSSPYWEVRNSACLAYTALVRRMIGFLNVQKRESARRALTGLEFFHRYPSLHPFLYNELKVATDMLSDATSGHSESNLAKVVHPSLCPMLILLSRLKPSAITSESGEELDPFLFMPFIRHCSTQSNLRVRVLASRALTCLVSNEKLPSILLNIVSELPSLETQIEAASFSSVYPNSGIHRTSFNSIHGMLLQLCSLLDANCRNLVDFSKKEKILDDLIQVLGTRSWIASPRWCPCPLLNASFIRVLDHMLTIARTGHISSTFYAIRDLLLELSMHCLDIESSNGLSYHDPTVAELREQAALSYFSCVLQASKEESEKVIQMPQRHVSPDLKLSNITETRNGFAGLQERLIRSLSDSSYEVQLATFKWLLKFLNSTEYDSRASHIPSTEVAIIQRWTYSNLQATMMKLLDSEQNHRCTYYILRILFVWNQIQYQKVGAEKPADISYVGTLDLDALFQFWDKLLSLYNLTRHAKTRQTLICCMAVCVKRYACLLTSHVLASSQRKTCGSKSDQLETSLHWYECITFFVNLVEEHSSPSEPVNMRTAAAESIIASGLLEQAELIGPLVATHENLAEVQKSCCEPREVISMFAHEVLGIWFSCIKLLEDEDDGVRQRLAENVQKCFSFKRSNGSSHGDEVPAQVEKVIELSFGYLSSVFGHWINYFDFLLHWVLNAAKHTVTNEDLVRRVFDKEIDNHHEEKLLICQICCYYLEKLPISKSLLTDMPAGNSLSVSDYLYGWRMRFFNQLTLFAKDCIGKMGGVDWIGGVGNHKDAFLPLYANLLGFYAVSNCILNGGDIEDGMPLMSDVVELGKTINPFSKNPLISNLYSLVVKSHENKVGPVDEGSICSMLDHSVWDGFDPYFLLGKT